MTESSKPDDELAGSEQPFIQHLVELRDRLVKASVAVLAVALVLAIYPGPGALYDVLAQPLVAHLPAGSTMIATSVISPFMVPLQVMLMTAFMIALPVVLYQVWAFVAPGLYGHEKKTGAATGLFQYGFVFCWRGVLLLSGLWPRVCIHPELCAQKHHGIARY
jgi:sec-independent protein translocase protein TatC